ncbi:hypothetical protein A8C56_12780 [Niabella ginsenosidivorans]|uniref:DUF2214 domain-containing protein n=1 Tax=Niabella ginsenosidivorans TaxID=1176587 RepID=A0A1A9I243_9BACT|nr:hypothetical protein [Niabella ginsenosidivorans]ANH81737.1 hypothetical protein A8C56_12780 [Niabella ginsenosidivorans]
MNMTLYHIALVIHIIGITIMAGTAFIDLITFRALCSARTTDAVKTVVLEDYLYKLQRFLGMGMLLILASGVTMMIKLHQVWGAQLWFRIKMAVLLLIIINGFVLRRRAGAALKKIIEKDTPVKINDKRWNSVKWSFTAVQVVQLVLFIIIYVLSVFKFN